MSFLCYNVNPSLKTWFDLSFVKTKKELCKTHSGHSVNVAIKFFVLMLFKNSMFDCFIPEVDSAARRI